MTIHQPTMAENKQVPALTTKQTGGHLEEEDEPLEVEANINSSTEMARGGQNSSGTAQASQKSASTLKNSNIANLIFWNIRSIQGHYHHSRISSNLKTRHRNRN